MIRSLVFLLALLVSSSANSLLYLAKKDEGGGGGCGTYATDPAPGLILHYKADAANLYQNSACSTAVTTDGDPIGCIEDIAGTISNGDLKYGNADRHTWEESFLNGKDAVQGDDGFDQRLDSNYDSGASGYTDITVVIEMEGGGSGRIYDIYTSTFASAMIMKVNDSSGNMAVAFDTVSGTKLTSGNYTDGTDLLVIVTWSFDDQTGVMRVNGTDVATDVSTGSAETWEPGLISAFSSRINWTESMIYDDILSSDEIEDLETCMGY